MNCLTTLTGILVLGLAFFSGSHSYYLRLFENEQFKGGRFTVEGNFNECINLIPGWDNEASSLYTDREACAVIFSEKSCEGNSFLVERPIRRLAAEGLNDDVSSIRFQPCPDLEKFWEDEP